MKVESESQENAEKRQAHCEDEKLPNGMNVETEDCKAQLRALQIDFENMEESLRNMLRHNGQSSENAKDDTTRQMHAYKNAISKFRNQINIVERENHALKRQISSITSHTSPNDVSQGVTPDPRHLSPPALNGECSGKSQLEDIRTTCLMLSDRIKRMEEQNTQLLVNSEKQRCDYERCLERVASQVIQALACQRRLQLECDSLRMQVHHLTGNRQFYPGHSPLSTPSHASDESPNGHTSVGSVSDDAFSPLSPTIPPGTFGQWPIGQQNDVTSGTHIDHLRPAFSPLFAGSCEANKYTGRAGLSPPAENGFGANPNIQLLERLFQLSGNNINGFAAPPVNSSEFPSFALSAPQRIQTAKMPPLHVIPESIEPGNVVKNAGLRQRLPRSGSEILSGAVSFGDIAPSRRALDDESVGCTSRSRDRQRSSRDRRVVRSRSFDNHSCDRPDIARPRQSFSPGPNEGSSPLNYRPGPPLSSQQIQPAENCDDSLAQNASPEAQFLVISEKENLSPRQRIGETSPSSGKRLYSPSQNRRALVENQKKIIPQRFTRQSRERMQDLCEANQHKRSRSQDARNIPGADTSPGSSFSRNAFQRSFRVTRSYEKKPPPGRASDDVWLPRSGKMMDDPSSVHTAISSFGSGRRRSHSKISDLPPPPPPPPPEEENLVNDQENDVIPPKQNVLRRKDGPGIAKQMYDLKKQALSKRESYTAACRKSQSLDHLYQMTEDEGKMVDGNDCQEPSQPRRACLTQTSYSTFDLHSKGTGCSTEAFSTSDTAPSNSLRTGSGNAQPNMSENCTTQEGKACTGYLEMRMPSPNNGRKFTTSQISPQSDNASNKGAKQQSSKQDQPAFIGKLNKRKTPTQSTGSCGQPGSERSFTSTENARNRLQMTSASSCEVLSAQTRGQTCGPQRRMSEGLNRGFSGKGKMSQKPQYSGNFSGSMDSSPPHRVNTDKKIICPPGGSKQQSVNTSPTDNLPGNRPALTSNSYSDLSSKNRSPPCVKRSAPMTSGSHPNLSKANAEVQVEQNQPPMDSRFQPPSRSFYETSLVSNMPQNNQQPSVIISKEEKYFRSRSVESPPKMEQGVRETKVPKRSLSSDRSSKRTSNLPRKEIQRQNHESKNDDSGKKKGNHPKSFVDIMKSKFGGKSSNSQSKKLAESEKSRRSDAENNLVQTPSVIDPRTLSLEPNSILAPGSLGKKGSKKKSESTSSPQDPVGRKLSQPFLKLQPPGIGSLPESRSARSEAGGRKSFLSRHNSKRNKASRLAALPNGEHFNNNPFGRVELIPVGSRVSLNGSEHNSTTHAQRHQAYPEKLDEGESQTQESLPSGGDLTDCDREVEAMTNRSFSNGAHARRRQNDYENVVLRTEAEQLAGDKDDNRQRNDYENVVIVDRSQEQTVSDTSPDQSRRRLGGCDVTNPGVTTRQQVRGKNTKHAGTSFKSIWGSLNNSLNKVGENCKSNPTLHQIGGGRCVPGEGKLGRKANGYAQEQKMFENVFISSVVEAQLQNQKESGETCDQSSASSGNYRTVSGDSTQDVQVCEVMMPGYCSSQTESGKSSMTFSTSESSKSGHSNFDSWPSKGVDMTSQQQGGRQGGSLDTCYRNIRTAEETERECGKVYVHSPRKVGSRSSLGSFGYGSGVSSNSTSSSSKGSVHRGRSSSGRSRKRAEGDTNRQRDSSSDSDLTPSQAPQSNSMQRKYATRKSLSPVRNTQSSRLQKPTRLSRLSGGASPGRVKMGVSSISPEFYKSDEKRNFAQADKSSKKLAPLNCGQQLSPALSRPTTVKSKEPRKSNLPCSTAVNIPISSRLIPQHTSIPVRYSSQRQQQQAR